MTEGGVDVWVVPLAPDGPIERAAWSVLSADERARAARFRRPHDRAVFVRTRARLRQLLASELAVDPDEIAIDAGPDGKPELAGQGLCFNVSHSGSLALIAVAARREVGVDVELIRTDVPWRDVAVSFFAPAEIAAIERTPTTARRRAFFDCWVRREAYLKGLGTGLRREGAAFRVPLDPAGGPVDDPWVAGGGAPGWCVYPLDVEPAYAAALAVDGTAVVTVRRAALTAR